MFDALDGNDKPYPGLRSFERGETHIFFGREETVSDMVDRMAGHRFLAVTGYSGSGKSSLVKVGLLDALDRGLLVDAGSSWIVAEFTPGGEPFARMTSALVKSAEREFAEAELGLIEAQLARGPKGLLDWLDDIDFPQDTNLLLVVDQFEEIFRYRQGRTGDDVNAFVQLLLASAQQRDRPIYVVITMRSDFLGDCARFTGLAEQINDGQFLTPRMSRQQCREAIERPAGVFGGKVEPALVTRMLNDMGGNPDQLPLMQHVLMLLWDRAVIRAGGGQAVLTLADYDALGGIGYVDWEAEDGGDGDGKSEAAELGTGKGALSNHADSVLASLTSKQQGLAERLFRALTESRGGGDRAVRRPVLVKQAAAITEASGADLQPVVEAFRAQGRNFLIARPAGQFTADTIIDISHESLIRQWGKLRAWAKEEQASAETYRHIERSAKQWNKGLGNLLSRFDLVVARKWLNEEHPNAAWAQRYGDAYDLTTSFLHKSVRARRRRRAVTTTLMVVVPAILFVLTSGLMAIAITGLPYLNPASEWSNFDVEPRSYLTRDVGTNTSRAIPGGRVIGTAELENAMHTGKLKGGPFVLMDVWYRKDANEYRLPGATYFANGGQYGSGTFDDKIQAEMKAKLEELTKGNLGMPIVFYCAGTSCWESYNASLRAIHLGYTQVYWYRGGASAWATAHERVNPDFDVVKFDLRGALDVAGEMFWTVKQNLLPTSSYAFDRGQSYLRRQRYDFAIDNFGDSIARGYNVVDSYVLRAQAYHGKHEFREAYADYTKAMELAPENANYLAARAQVRADAGDYDGAIQDFHKAMAADAKLASTGAVRLATAFNLRGNRSYSAQEYDKAIADYTEAFKVNPKEVVYVVNRGNTWAQKGAFDKALADYATAIQAAPDDPGAYKARGDAYYEKGDYTAAIADYTKAASLSRSDTSKSKILSDTIAQRAFARYYANDFANAVVDFVAVDRITGNDNVYRALFRYLARAKAQGGDTAAVELLADARRMVESGAMKSNAWPMPVIALFSGTATPEATLKDAGSDDETCEAHYYIGQWYLLHGNKEAARPELALAANGCKKTYIEYRAARAELTRLGRPE
jgi:PQQ-dependent catabolism-associated CXXCW motif protein